jgi:ABC-type polysaccharide/polyol phosphate export permease
MLPSSAMLHSEVQAPRRVVPGGSSPLSLLRQAVADVVSRRRLIRYLVQAEMKKRGSNTFLGNLWWILDPVLQMSVYVVFVSVIARRPAPDYPLFIFAALLPWKWFIAVVNDATTSVIRHDRLIRGIAFPKLVLPIATSTAGTVGFLWGMVPLGVLLLLDVIDAKPPHRLSLMILWVPVIAGVQYVFTLAAAIFVSAANVFFRDLGNAISHLLRLWWFLSPGLYALTSLQDLEVVKHNPIIYTLASLNPFAVLFEAYRSVIYGTADGLSAPHSPDLVPLGFLLLGSLAFLAVCVVFFKRVEPDFAKVL